MVAKKLLFFITIILLLATNSCQKYEDGPLISLRSKDKRLYNNWNVTSLKVDGVESIDEFNEKCLNTPIYFWFDKKEYKAYYGFEVSNHSGRLYAGGTAITLVMGDFDDSLFVGFGPFNRNIAVNWWIKRLTNDELWMECHFDYKHYEFKAIE
ncbi:MAG: hypothetical protein A2265_11280 [Bacteroidetes bacterium RIFOXYA12_FULL_33_9]|nr:MAG: hypothetical protein A2265_11280 [Bacteroidetes bacterium RIFOXYA12_FULL_33_9]